MIKSILLILGYTTFSLAQIPSPGSCPPVQTVLNFNKTKFAGKWYESERYFNIFQVTGRCNAVFINNNDTYFGAEYSEIGITHGLRTSGVFELIPLPANTDGRFRHKFEIFDFPIEVFFWILGTDYENYAVAFSCFDLFVMNLKLVWILTRKRLAGTFGAAYDILDKANIDRNILQTSDQIFCPINS